MRDHPYTPQELRTLGSFVRRGGAAQAAANAVIDGRATMGDALLLELLRERRRLRDGQILGIEHLKSAITAEIDGDDRGCWSALLESMLVGDHVAEIRERVAQLQARLHWMFPPGTACSAILLLGDSEWMW